MAETFYVMNNFPQEILDELRAVFENKEYDVTKEVVPGRFWHYCLNDKSHPVYRHFSDDFDMIDEFILNGDSIELIGEQLSETIILNELSSIDTFDFLNGDEVIKGQVVAAVGSSGRATGPHLDWRINWFNVRLDPELALKVLPID